MSFWVFGLERVLVDAVVEGDAVGALRETQQPTVGIPFGNVHAATLLVDAVGVENEAVGEVELFEERAAARHRECGPPHGVGGEIVVHGDVEVVDERNLLEPCDGVFARTDLDFQIVAERELYARLHLGIAGAEYGVVVVGVVYQLAGHRIDVGSAVLTVQHRLEREIQSRGDDVADGIQPAFLENVHHIDLCRQVRGEVEVVDCPELAVEMQHQLRSLRSVWIPDHLTAVILQIPFLRQRKGGVPVDGLGDFDGDGEGDDVLHARLEMFPRNRLEEKRIGGVHLTDKLRRPFHGDVVIPFQRSRLVLFAERIELRHRHADVG